MLTSTHLSILRPKPCPYPLVRIGGRNDGSYLVPDALKGISACFSPGSNNFKTFEDHLTREYDIDCHMCDFTSDAACFRTPIISGKQTFEKKWLALQCDSNSITLEDWVQRRAPCTKKDLLLQMDIEGAEYAILGHISHRLLARFRIIVIELHNLDRFCEDDSEDHTLGALLDNLSVTHRCVHAHPNNCCGEVVHKPTGMNVPRVLETTWLRKDRIRFRRKIQPSLPHPLDIPCNARSKPPLHLNERWLSTGKRSFDASLKVLQDKLDFAKRQLHLAKGQSNEAGKYSFTATRNLYSVALDHDVPVAHMLDNQSEYQDISRGKTFFLSSSYKSLPASGQVFPCSPFFFHTAFGVHQSITIDLRQAVPVHYLIIGNRSDCCQERASLLLWSIHDSQLFDRDTSLYPVLISPDFLKPGAPPSVTPLFGRRGRFLTVTSPTTTALHFSSLKIMSRLR
jgi:hypothetical protein